MRGGEQVSDVLNPQRLKIAMMRRGKSSHAVATELGVRVPGVTKWLKGQRAPSAITVEHLAEVLDFPVAWFYAPDMQELPAWVIR